MKVLGLRTVIYHVKDLAPAKAWYTGLLGKEPYFDQPFYVGYNVGGYELGLLPAEEGTGTLPITLVYWGVADAGSAYQELLASDAKQHEPLQDVGDGIILGTVTDPAGNIFGIIENRHFKVRE